MAAAALVPLPLSVALLKLLEPLQLDVAVARTVIAAHHVQDGKWLVAHRHAPATRATVALKEEMQANVVAASAPLPLPVRTGLPVSAANVALPRGAIERSF